MTRAAIAQRSARYRSSGRRARARVRELREHRVEPLRQIRIEGSAQLSECFRKARHLRRYRANGTHEIAEVVIELVALGLERIALLCEPLHLLDEVSRALDVEAQRGAELGEPLARQDHVLVTAHLLPRGMELAHE